MAESYLEKSGFPIEEPNMQLEMPGLKKEEAGVDIDVSSSQVQPSPNSDAQTEETPANFPMHEGEAQSIPISENPHSPVKIKIEEEKKATYKALMDVKNLVKMVLSKNGELTDEQQDIISNMNDSILENHKSLPNRVLSEFLSIPELDEKITEINNSVASGGIMSDEAFANIVRMDSATHEKGSGEPRFFDEDSGIRREAFLDKVGNLNLDDETKREIMALLSEGKHDEANKLAGLNIFEAGFLFSWDWDGSPLIDGLINKLGDTIYGIGEGGNDFLRMHLAETSEIEGVRRQVSGTGILDRWREEGADLQHIQPWLLELADGDEDLAGVYLDYLVRPELDSELFKASEAISWAMIDTLREFSTPGALGQLALIAGADVIVAGVMAAWTAAIAEPTWYGELGAGAVTAPLFVGLGITGIGGALKGAVDATDDWQKGEVRGHEYTYQMALQSIHGALGALFIKHGFKKKTTYSTITVDGIKLKIPSEQSVLHAFWAKMRPNYRLKDGNIIDANINSYSNRISAGWYKDFNVFEQDILKHVKDGNPIPNKIMSNLKDFFDLSKVKTTETFNEFTIQKISDKTGINVADQMSHISVSKKGNISLDAKNEHISVKTAYDKKRQELSRLEKEAGSTPSWQVQADITNLRAEIEGMGKGLRESKLKMDNEKASNKRIRKDNKNAGEEIIIHSKAESTPYSWKSIRIRRDGEILVEHLPKEFEVIAEGPNVGKVNYFGINKGKKISKDASYEDSGNIANFGPKLSKSSHPAIDNLIAYDKIRPNIGDRVGDWMYIDNNIGWRNLKQDGFINTDNITRLDWLKEASKQKSPMFEGDNMISHYYESFKGFMSKAREFIKDKPTGNRSTTRKYKAPDTKVYTGKGSKVLFRIFDELQVKSKNKGRDVGGEFKIVEGNEPQLDIQSKKLAKVGEKAKHDPHNKDTKMAYEALNNELPELYQGIIDKGYKIEIWKGEGEPYANSKAMMDDVIKNKHLYIFSTKKAFGPWDGTHMTINEFLAIQLGKGTKVKGGKESLMGLENKFNDKVVDEFPLLKESTFKDVNGERLTMNDLFRSVHDIFGHAMTGNGFGKFGEWQAYYNGRGHLSYQAGLAFHTETAIQNSVFNSTGKYMQQKVFVDKKSFDESGSIMKVPKETVNLADRPPGPIASIQTLKAHIKDSKPNDFKENGGNYRIIADDFSEKNIDFILSRLGDTDFQFLGESLKKWWSPKNRKLSKEQIKERNKMLIDKLIEKAGKEGRTIHRADAEGFYKGESESSHFLTGDIKTTETHALAWFLGQESSFSQFGEIFTNTGIIKSYNAKTVENVSGKDAYTKVYTRDGGYVFIEGKPTKGESTLGVHRERITELDARNTNLYRDKGDADLFVEYFGPEKPLSSSMLPEGLDLRNQNTVRINNLVGEKGYFVVDWSNVSSPEHRAAVEKMYADNKKIDFVWYDTNGKRMKTEVEYLFGDKTPKVDGASESPAFIPKILKEGKSTINPQVDIGVGSTGRIVTIKEYPEVEGDPVKPNKGLDKNHIGNINLEKLPADIRPICEGIVNKIGDPQYTEHARQYYSAADQYSIAMRPDVFQNIVECILIDGKEGGIWKKDGSAQDIIRTSAFDIIGAEIFLIEALKDYRVNPTKAKANLIKKIAMANELIRGSAGRATQSMNQTLNGADINMGNITGLDDGTLVQLQYIFGQKDPATIMQQFVELRRNNLLTSASSITRSTVGNTASLLFSMADKLVAGVYNDALSAFDYAVRGGDWKPLKNNTTMDVVYFTEGFLQGTKGNLRLAKNILLGKESAIAESAIARNEGWYTEPRIPGTAGKIVTTPQRIQILLDAMIRKPAEQGFINEFAHKIAQSEKLKGEAYAKRITELTSKPTENMMSIAKQNSQWITFQSELGYWGKLFNRARTGKGTEALQIPFPFFNTSANIMKRAYNMTPLGAFTGKYFTALKDGLTKSDRGAHSDHTARIVVGTATMWWMNQALGNGGLQYEGDWKDMDKSMRELKAKLGYQPNSIYWQNDDGTITSFSTVGFEPMASIMSIANAWKEAEDETWTKQSLKSVEAWMQQFKQNPFMQGASDLISLTEGEKDIVNYMTKLSLSSFVPNMIMQAGKIKDDIRYEYPYDKEWADRVFDVDNWYNSLLSEFRYIESGESVPKINIFGEPVRVADPKGALLAMRTITGGEEPEYRAVSEEILRLSEGMGSIDFSLRKYKSSIELTPKQMLLLEVAAGREFYKMISDKMLGEYKRDPRTNFVLTDENGYNIVNKGDTLIATWKETPDLAKIETINITKELVRETQLFSIAPELFMKGEFGDWKLRDPKEMVIYKEGKKEKGFEERDVIVEQLTKNYRESTKGELEISRANNAANEVITLMRQGYDKSDAINEIINKLKKEVN